MTSPQRMDKSLTEIKEAIKDAQQAFDVDIRTYPQDALQTAGAVLNELEGEVGRLISELTRDVERPVGLAPNAKPENTGLKATNIRSIRAAHGNTTDAQYQEAKQKQANSKEPYRRQDVRNAGSKPSTGTTPNPSSIRQLRAENARLTARVKTLEDTLKYHQIPLPM